ncbi:hypothetical protein [Flavicella sp.]|uniref:hypothetical protein n=1 Tax=Flavicella sp. TaxID=2957742 RepID=UPI003017A9BB
MKKILRIAFMILGYITVNSQTNLKVYYVDLKDGQNTDGNFMKEYTPTTSVESSNIHRRNKIKLYPSIEFQTLEGVGGSFNEIGGEALILCLGNYKMRR